MIKWSPPGPEELARRGLRPTKAEPETPAAAETSAKPAPVRRPRKPKE
jgi:hypothetical protein